MGKLKTNEDYFAYSKTLTAIPSEDLSALLVNHKIRIPYYIHRFVLKETIYSKVFQNKLYSTYTDELKYRLRGYHEYSLFLLEKLISDFNLDFDAAKYKEILFDLLFLNRDLYAIKDSFINDLEKLKYKYAVDFEKISYADFRKFFSGVFYEPTGYLDGVNLGIIKDVMIHSSTLGDLKGLGDKYGVKIPRRINKTQLVDILVARFRLTEDEIVLLNSKSVLELEIYAKEKGFNISIDLKKSDMMEYLVFSLGLYHQEKTKDAHNYQIPLGADIDSVQVESIQFEANDQDIPVTELEEVTPAVVETKVEEVIEAQPVETPKEEVEEVVVPEPVKKAEVVAEPVVEPVVEPVDETKEPELEATVAEEPIIPVVPQVKPKEEPYRKAEEPLDFTDEEKALLDEKINQIIKKYNKKRHRKLFWTIVLLSLLGVVLLGAGYIALYYFYINPGVLPFGLPVLW
jgi:hypothetical protein